MDDVPPVIDLVPEKLQSWLIDEVSHYAHGWEMDDSFLVTFRGYESSSKLHNGVPVVGAQINSSAAVMVLVGSDKRFATGLVSDVSIPCFINPDYDQGRVSDTRFAVDVNGDMPVLYTSARAGEHLLELTRMTYNRFGERVKVADLARIENPRVVEKRTIICENKFCGYCQKRDIVCLCPRKLRESSMQHIANSLQQLRFSYRAKASAWSYFRDMAGLLQKGFANVAWSMWLRTEANKLARVAATPMLMSFDAQLRGTGIENARLEHFQFLLARAVPRMLDWASPEREWEWVSDENDNQTNSESTLRSSERGLEGAVRPLPALCTDDTPLVKPYDAAFVPLKGGGGGGATEFDDSGPQPAELIKCPGCEMHFSRTYELEKHMSAKHKHLRPHECSYCKRTFTRRSHVVEHVAAVHENKREATCETCGLGFRTNSKLSRHVRTVHMRLRPYSCPSCRATFCQRSDVTRHAQAKHGGSAPAREGEVREHSGDDVTPKRAPYLVGDDELFPLS